MLFFSSFHWLANVLAQNNSAQYFSNSTISSATQATEIYIYKFT